MYAVVTVIILFLIFFFTGSGANPSVPLVGPATAQPAAFTAAPPAVLPLEQPPAGDPVIPSILRRDKPAVNANVSFASKRAERIFDKKSRKVLRDRIGKT